MKSKANWRTGISGAVDRRWRGEDCACALAYDESGHCEPVVSAIATQESAGHFRSVARRYGIPIYEDSDLAAQLADLGESTIVPAELYPKIAKVVRDLNR